MVAEALAPLFKPLRLGPTTLRNRIVMSSLTRSRSVPTNVPNSINLEYYQQRAKGGAGLIMTEGVLVSQQGTEWENAPGIWSKEQTEAWKKIVDAVHAEGSAIYAQIWHVGRVAHPDAPEHKASGRPVYAPSAIAARGGKFRFIKGVPGYVKPTEIPDPREAIEEYKRAALNAKEAGFDGIEVHGANGYLVHQFLDSSSNHRTDAWGGSVEKRAKFALVLLKELVEIMGPNRVGIKLSPNGGYNDMGMPLQETIDTYGYLLTEADKLPLAFIKLTRYDLGFDPQYDDVPRGTDFSVMDVIRPFIKNAPVILNGGITPEEGAKLLETGAVDAVEFGRLWIGHPELAKRIKHGKPLDAQLDWTTVYGHGNSIPYEQQKKGYTDYPEAQY